MTKEKKKVEMAQEKLGQFRQKVYKSFAGLKDAAMDLLDGLSSREKANSPVELSLNSQFQRGHGSVYQAIGGCYGADETEKEKVLQAQREAVGSILPLPQERSHVLLVTDVTPRPRPDGKTVADRSYTYSGGGHIEVGHNYSVLGYIPEWPQPHSWCVPLALERVPSDQNKEMFGIEQAVNWAKDETLPFHEQLVVTTADRAYSSRSCLYKTWQQPNLVLLTRLRNNQVVYHQPEPVLEKKSGHPRWYGQAFKLNQPQTWSEPSATYEFERHNSRGKVERISAKAWSNMLLRGKHTPVRLPLH
ncbi:MAG: transposase, partial [bacterium]|nr:transposase [bacterium]